MSVILYPGVFAAVSIFIILAKLLSAVHGEHYNLRTWSSRMGKVW